MESEIQNGHWAGRRTLSTRIASVIDTRLTLPPNTHPTIQQLSNGIGEEQIG